MRICSVCGKEITEGYMREGGDEYYCEECLHKVYTDEEYEAEYEAGEMFWTSWED